MGLHGWEREGQDRADSARVGRRVSELRRKLERQLSDLKGIRIESKKFGLAIHYRAADPPMTKMAWSRLKQSFRAFSVEFRIQPGKAIWEILPRAVRGKGAAAKTLLNELPQGTAAVYIGDDEGDESAFAALRKRGITIRVGSAHITKAQFRLQGPAQVLSFLSTLDQFLENRIPARLK